VAVGLAEVLLVLVVLQVVRIRVVAGLLFLGVACQEVLVVQIRVVEGLLFLGVPAFLGQAVRSLVVEGLLVQEGQGVQILVEAGQEVLPSYQEGLEGLLFLGAHQGVLQGVHQGGLVLEGPVVQSLGEGLLFLEVPAFQGQVVLLCQDP